MNRENINHKPNKVQNGLPPKIFKARNSVLTDLLEDNIHIRTIYNIAWIVVITSQLRYLIHNYITYNRFNFNLENFKISFDKPFPLVYIWLWISLSTLLPYFGFVLWAIIRHEISKRTVPFFDRLSIIIFISFLVTYTYYFASLILQNDFKPASGVALMLELVRGKMKFYAFVRSNVPRTIKFKYHDKDGIMYPNITKYVYFLFVPTLIYQDEYPRSDSIRWKKVTEHLINFIGTLLLLNIIADYGTTRFEMFVRNPFTWTNFLIIALELAPPAGMVMLGTLYLFFHCWSNAFAEMLRFSDRSFYKDVWTSTSAERYFRTWNGIVYDWLYVYIYKDFYENVCPNNKLVARGMVFFVSAFYHELILGFTFNVFSPYLFLLFFCLTFFVKLVSFNIAVGNLILLLWSAIGSSILLCGYGTQYYYQKIL